MLKFRNIIPFVIVILVVVILVVVLIFSKTKKCDTKECFLDALAKCKKYSYEDEEWKYRIIAKRGDDCIVNVENKFIKDVDADIVERLRGKSMECYVSLSSKIIMPHEDIDNCHGLLKEEILSIMLEKLQEYVVQQIGKFE